MKKYLFIAVALVALALPAVAQERGRSEEALDMRARIEENRADLDARRKVIQAQFGERRNSTSTATGTERKLENAERRTEMQQNIAERRVKNAERVILATIERLEKISDRIESRMEKIEEAGGDVSESEVALASARNHLEEARDAASALGSIDLSGETAQDNFQMVREAVSGVKEHIRLAHQELSLAVRNLKSAQSEASEDKDGDETATSTEEDSE